MLRARGLELDHEGHVGKCGDELGQRRHAKAASAPRERPAAVNREAGASVGRLNLLEAQRGDAARPSRRPVERGVVDDDRDTVRRDVRIELEGIDALLHRRAERFDRVLGRDAGRAPVPEHRVRVRIEEDLRGRVARHAVARRCTASALSRDDLWSARPRTRNASCRTGSAR